MARAASSDVPHDDILYPEAIPFVLVHLAALGALWSGVTTLSVVLGVSLYLLRMFAVTAGYHRYFSHRSFKTSRVFQFVLALLCQSTAQQGALWWAAKHREHHKHSDTELDVHSPRHRGFLFAHVGWIFARRDQRADYRLIPDLTRYPELVWLDKHHKVPAFALAIFCVAVAGWPGLFVSFFMSTVALFHCTFFINSLAHVVGSQRYVTGDDSRNNWWLAVITLGEGWHNNHHFYPASTRQGFRWWEIDVTFYILKMLSWVGVVWDLKAPPENVVRGDKPLPRPVVEKVAQQLAHSFLPDVNLDALRARAQRARAQAEAKLAELHMPELHWPELPSFEDIRRRAQERLAHTPSLDDIVERTRQIILEAVSVELFGEPVPVRA